MSFNQSFELIGVLRSGKTLGGSSSINGGHYTRGLAAQYDSWSTLLETSEASVGWNWQGLWSYMKKVLYISSALFTEAQHICLVRNILRS